MKETDRDRPEPAAALEALDRLEEDCDAGLYGYPALRRVLHDRVTVIREALSAFKDLEGNQDR